MIFEWIANNAETIIAATAVSAAAGIAVASLIKGRKRGSCKCTGNCATCKMSCSGNNSGS